MCARLKQILVAKYFIICDSKTHELRAIHYQNDNLKITKIVRYYFIDNYNYNRLK